MRIIFVYDTDDRYWDDGLKKAIDILSCKHDIRKQNGYFDPIIADFALVWSNFNTDLTQKVLTYPIKKGICFGGGSRVAHPNMHKFDKVFCELKWQRQEFRRYGVDAKLAFGVNTDIFKPISNQPKIWDAIYPGAFAVWKRHDIFSRKYGNKGLAVGYMQPNDHERICYDVCKANGTVVLPQVTSDVLAYLYNSSKKVHVTADMDGGGARSIAEGIACGLTAEVEQDNPMLLSHLEDMQNHVPTYEEYAQKLVDGIKEALA